MAVQDELARLGMRAGKSGAVDHIVQPAFQHDDQVFASRALDTQRLFKIAAELPLQQPISALYLLLFAQLQTVARDLRAAGLPVLARDKVALLNRALLRKAPQTL